MDYHDKNLMDRALPSLVFWNGRLIAERIFYNLNISLSASDSHSAMLLLPHAAQG